MTEFYHQAFLANERLTPSRISGTRSRKCRYPKTHHRQRVEQGRVLHLLIDFAAVHERYLKGRKEGLHWVFTPVNPETPVSGIYLSSYQVFSSNAVGLGLYLRNDVDAEGRAVKVFSGLKLLFSHKVHNKYPLAKDENRISLTLDIGAVRSFYAWLIGAQPGFQYDIVRPGASPKQISGFESDLVFPLTLRATEFSPSTGHRLIDVGLSDTDIFHCQMHCIALAKLLYPSVSDTAIVQHLVPRVKFNAHAFALPSVADSAGKPDEQDPSSTAAEPGIRRERAEKPSNEQMARAIYGVGKNKWPAQDIQTIKYIQESSTPEAMDRLIKAGNSGDFTEWDRIYNLVRSGKV